MKIKNCFLALGLCSTALILIGCSTEPLNFTPTEISFSADKINGDFRTVSVSFAKDHEKTGELEVGKFGNQYELSFRTTYKDALEEAIVTSGVFDPNSKTKIAVFAKVLRFGRAPMSSNYRTLMDTQYKVQNLNTGQIIFMKNISSEGEANLGYAFSSDTRFTEARNRCVRNNIYFFIKELQEFAGAQKTK